MMLPMVIQLIDNDDDRAWMTALYEKECCWVTMNDHRGFGRKIYVGDSWYHLNFSLMIDDIGGPVTERLIEEIEDCLSWPDLQIAKTRKEQLHKAADVPSGWFYMSDWVSAE